ncbi:hypothetical protein Bbelb_310220 [Branchiostoma belcheri]|nr:hypothetical protein Bbelb_310220 [Branchiostoma belcheri]
MNYCSSLTFDLTAWQGLWRDHVECLASSVRRCAGWKPKYGRILRFLDEPQFSREIVSVAKNIALPLRMYPSMPPDSPTLLATAALCPPLQAFVGALGGRPKGRRGTQRTLV